MKKLILFILLIPLFGLAQNRPLVDAETFMGRDTSYFVNTLTAQNAYGVKHGWQIQYFRTQHQ